MRPNIFRFTIIIIIVTTTPTVIIIAISIFVVVINILTPDQAMLVQQVCSEKLIKFLFLIPLFRFCLAQTKLCDIL